MEPVQAQPNPYQPPSEGGSPGSQPPIDDTPFPASRGRRFGNLMIDGIVLGVVVSALFSVFDELGFEPEGFVLQWVPEILGYLLTYVVPETFLGRTVGKFATGTKVVDVRGGKPSVGQVLGRTLIRLVPFDGLSFLWGDNTGWHDQWSRTLVVPLLDPYSDIPTR
ncbi:MAG: RDD family protein [Nannocystales bacterium]